MENNSYPMKRYIYRSITGVALIAALLALFGCDSIKPDRCKECADVGEGLRHVTVTLGGEARVLTKVYGVTDTLERVVRNSRLYVFTSEGYQINNWDASSGSVDFYLTDGTYDIVAVCNMKDLPGTEATRDDLYAVMAPIERNSLEPETGGFVMVGALPAHIIKADEKITVLVERLVSKVSFKVRTLFEDHMASYPFLVEAVYMTNVAGTANLGPEHVKLSAGDPWYNRMDYEPRDPSDTRRYPEEMLYGAFHKDLANGDSIASGHVFYVYPNANEDSRDTTAWSPRCTRFVVKARINGTPTYYAVTLDGDGKGVASNRHYHIDLTIKGWGTDHPEENPDDKGSMIPAIRVEDWRDGGGVLEPDL